MQDDTVNAAAVVLAAAARSTTGLLPHHRRVEDRASTATVWNGMQKTRWWSRLKAKLLCFRPRSHGGHPRRIADYASPEAAHSSSASYYYHTHHATRPAVAFVAPPPSPASSLVTSESPSPVQQQQLVRLDSSYSSPTASIFAVGPYAREPQQLVSPPAFSAGLTEPSTAPLTPPSEPSAACGCPHSQPAGSSPEVPFARFLSPSFQGYQYHCQLQPGSPIGGTIASSPVSTSSSPPGWMYRHRRSEEGSPPSREFVFGNGVAAGEWTTTFAGGSEDGGRGASTCIGDVDTAEEGNHQQWPFGSSFPN